MQFSSKKLFRSIVFLNSDLSYLERPLSVQKMIFLGGDPVESRFLAIRMLLIIYNLERFNGYSQPPPPQNGNINVQPRLPTSDQMPEIRKYKKRFNSEINCASLWGVNLLIGTNNGLLLLDRSGQVSPLKPIRGPLTKPNPIICI